MKKTLTTLALCLGAATTCMADGWPSNYGGVMLQGFYWDSYSASKWEKLESQAEELGQYFDLIWVPQSGNTNSESNSMGYLPYYFFEQTSSFGTEAQLRSMIAAFKENGIGTIADVVINHHNTTGWFTFPAETYNGVTYQLQSTDICADDDGGSTATQAATEGVTLSSNNDEGEDWSGCRDLDHQSENVQTVVKAYLKYLVDDLGYTGFRYDMVKGFDGSHVGDYNDAAGVEYSVGEYWDSNSLIQRWIKATDYRSAAFDFQFRYNVRDAINDGKWNELNSTNNLINSSDWRQWAVTFVENHDTEYRSSSEAQDPIYSDTLAANAYLLSMPGTPCVFMRHWLDCKQEIKGMIDLRKAVGITNMSDYSVYGSTSISTSYGVDVVGDNGELLCIVGSAAATRAVSSATWIKAMEGYHYALYVKKTNEMVWADKASGEYDDPFSVLLSLASSSSDARLVYTTDGTTPSATNGTQLSASGSITISEPTTLKVGLLKDGAVTGIIEREYTFSAEFEPYEITVNVNADNAGSVWAAAYSTASSPYINYWLWNDEGNHAPTNATWPGDKVTTTTTADGRTWFTQTYTIESRTDYISFVFSVGTGTPQTVDVTDVNETKYLEITSTKSGTKYTVEDVTDDVTPVTAVKADTDPSPSSLYYDLSGRAVKNPTRGVYIHNGAKILVK